MWVEKITYKDTMMTRDKIQEMKMAFAFFIQNTQIHLQIIEITRLNPVNW